MSKTCFKFQLISGGDCFLNNLDFMKLDFANLNIEKLVDSSQFSLTIYRIQFGKTEPVGMRDYLAD